jgi:RNA recognition motif-containing protein
MGNRLYVGNLSYNSTEESLREAFSRCGEVTEVHIVMDRATGQSRGFAFVTMANAQDAQKAIDMMAGQCARRTESHRHDGRRVARRARASRE